MHLLRKLLHKIHTTLSAAEHGVMCPREMIPLILSTLLLSVVASALNAYGIYLIYGCFPAWSESTLIGYLLVGGLAGLTIWGRYSEKTSTTNAALLWGRSAVVVVATFISSYYLLFVYLSRTVALPFAPNAC